MTDAPTEEKLQRALLLAGIRASLERCSVYIEIKDNELRIATRYSPARYCTAAWLQVATDGAIFARVRGGGSRLVGHVRDLCGKEAA